MLNEVVQKYLGLLPNERNHLKLLLKQIDNKEQLNGRRNFTGHITGSAIVLSPDRRKVLLVYHPAFGQWQMPGGHWDEDETGPWMSATREALEETGVGIGVSLQISNDFQVPLQIDSHVVPSSSAKKEPEHYHHDFRYGFIASSEVLNLQDEVIRQAEWLPVGKVDNARIRQAARSAQEIAKKLKG